MTRDPTEAPQASPQEHHTRLGPLRFLTAVRYPQEAGSWQSQTARRLRRLGAPAVAHRDAIHPAAAIARLSHHWSAAPRPQDLNTWISLCFMLGAGGFVLGCSAALWPARLGPFWSGTTVNTWTFVIGAVFFTTAAGLQWLQSMFSELADRARCFKAWRPLSLGYWAALVQFFGTLLFNVSTSDARLHNLDPLQEEILVWTPNLLGSICFLVSSQLAAMEYSHGWFSARLGDLSWWIVYLNLLGSILFGVSVAAAWVKPDGDLVNPVLANLTTLSGAICFLVAAYLLQPEVREKH